MSSFFQLAAHGVAVVLGLYELLNGGKNGDRSREHRSHSDCQFRFHESEFRLELLHGIIEFRFDLRESMTHSRVEFLETLF